MKDKINKLLIKIGDGVQPAVEIPANEVFGDYSTNMAMIALADPHRKLHVAKKRAGKLTITDIKNPREFAGVIVNSIKKHPEISKVIDKIEIAGPGFINFWLSKDYLLKELAEVTSKGGKYGQTKLGAGKIMVIDYSSPNIAKRFGIGHLRSTVIGQALYNLYQALGYKTIGDNHLGDWGTQFGTLLYQIYAKALTEKDLSVDRLEELYVEFNSLAKDNEKLWDEARAWFKKLEDGDPEAKKLWKIMVDISIKEFNKIYDLLGVKIDYAYGESFYEDYMKRVIELVREKDLTKKSEGAEIVEFKVLPPAMLIKNDGATTYYTRDLATILYRVGSWKPNLIIYEVGSEQALHFKQVFETARLMGWDKNCELVHIGHGLIRWQHGKMSTREGNAIKLEDVLDQAIAKAREIIEKSETGRGLSDSEKEKVATAVGVGAIKYFDLSHQPTSDIIFDWNKIFMLEGNSAPYLQYTVARINSVLNKAKSAKKEETKQPEIDKFEESLLRALCHFEDVIMGAAESFSPNLLANYLFELAQKYNLFYNEDRIIGEPKEAFRLKLSKAVSIVLKNGLKLLGIETPGRM
jgi:arginyl-tRNA synthetase